MKKQQQTIKLSELNNMARKIAEFNLKVKGEYYCMIGGIKTKVVE